MIAQESVRDATPRGSIGLRGLAEHHALVIYFGACFLLSWGSGLVLLGPKVVRGEAISAVNELLLFPILVIGVGLIGILLTAVVEGRDGLRKLVYHLTRGRVGARWYAVALLLPPTLILLVLLALCTVISPVFAPSVFPLGVLFGLFPGLVEELGWTGFALPRVLSNGRGILISGIVLGVLWGLWHLPVVDYLGAAAPHGAYWLPFFLAFIALVTAVRVLIVWVYRNTTSLWLAQLLHASSTASLVILSPAHTSPSQETFWYAVYAGALWIVVGVIAARYGTSLQKSRE